VIKSDMRTLFLAEVKARAGDFYEAGPGRDMKIWRETYETNPTGFIQLEIYFSEISHILLLSAILIGPKHRRQGLGTYAMNLICQIADKFNWPITGHIEPLAVDEAHPPLTVDQLRAFYKKFGFVRDKRRGHVKDDIIRKPKKRALANARALGPVSTGLGLHRGFITRPSPTRS
jgi:hypothetical protein